MSIIERLESLSYKVNKPYSEVMSHYENRVWVIKDAYGWAYKGRESHIKEKAYRGTEDFYIKQLRNSKKNYQVPL